MYWQTDKINQRLLWVSVSTPNSGKLVSCVTHWICNEQVSSCGGVSDLCSRGTSSYLC